MGLVVSQVADEYAIKHPKFGRIELDLEFEQFPIIENGQLQKYIKRKWDIAKSSESEIKLISAYVLAESPILLVGTNT